MKSSRHDPGADPFTVGAAVAVERGGNDAPYSRMFVAAVHKNGNFVLAIRPGGRPDPQQYRPYGALGHSTGGSFGGTVVRPWTAEVAAEQARRVAKWRHYRRAEDLRKLLERPDLIDRDFLASICEVIAWRAVTEGRPSSPGPFTFRRERR